MTKKVLMFFINSIMLIALFCILTFLKVNSISPVIKLILLIAGNIIFILSVIFKWFKLKSLSRFFYVLFIIYTIVVIGYAILYSLGILETISSVSGLKEYILSTKEKGVFVYILIQTAQVIFLPVPAAVICVVGSLIYGPLLGALYCTIGILLGSYISFFLGKSFGYKLVSWIVGQSNTNKYSEIIRKRGGFFLCLAFLLPMFPDDILCLIAGITNMTFKSFFLVSTITRPIGVIFMAFFGSGQLIPFSGWGLYVWGIILVLAIIMVVVTYKYQDKMEEFIMKKVFRKKDKKIKESN